VAPSGAVTEYVVEKLCALEVWFLANTPLLNQILGVGLKYLSFDLSPRYLGI